LLVCLVLLPSGAIAADDAALRALDACRAKLDARRDIGLERIVRRCPELLPALQAATWNELLPQGMRKGGPGPDERRDDISAESLRELGELVRGVHASSTSPTRRSAPDTDKLAPVLAGLGEQGQQGASRWERLKRWLQDTLDQREDEADEKSLLGDLGQKFDTSEGVAEVITYTGYGLVFLLVCFVIWSELRAAGLFGGARRGARAAATEWRRRLLLADVLAAPLAERPGLLLKLLGEALTRSHRLPAADGLTAGALVRQARLDSQAERAGLERVAATAEAVRYGPRTPDPQDLEGAVSAARALLDKLAARKPAAFRRADR
jgi:hypothetical protein